MNAFVDSHSLQTMKTTLLRAFTSADMTEFLKASSRPDCPAVLHNVCFLHGALRLRASFAGRSGWNVPGGLAELGITELFVSGCRILPSVFDANRVSKQFTVYQKTMILPQGRTLLVFLSPLAYVFLFYVFDKVQLAL